RHIKTPLKPARLPPPGSRDQRVLVGAISIGEIGGNCRALGDLEVAVLQQRYLLPWVESAVLLCLGLAGSRQDRTTLVLEAELVQRPMGAQGAAGSDAPQYQPPRRSAAHRYH